MPNRTHTDREYSAKLETLREGLVLMAGRVEEMIADAIEALTTRDPVLARRTIQKDHDVNRAEMINDELCLLILARWQPMASDLRFLTLALKMVTDLERIGDLAVNICERAIDLSAMPALPDGPSMVSLIPRMATLAQSMVRDAIDAFIQADPELARQVHARDDEVDDLYDEVFSEILDTMIADAATVHRGIHVQSVAKWLERIGDHATNIAEEVVFMTRGKDIRHMGKLGEPE